MTFSVMFLGLLIILTAFNVGEGIWKKIGFEKKGILTLLILCLVLYFVPNIVISGITFTWVGFVLPIIFSTVIILNVRNIKKYVRMFVAALIAFCFGIIYNLITFDVYETNIMQPYLVLALIVGSIPLIAVGEPKRLFASNTIGFLFAELVFYLSRYSLYGDYYLTLGSEKIITILLVGFVFSEIVYMLYRKIRVKMLRRKLLKREHEKMLVG